MAQKRFLPTSLERWIAFFCGVIVLVGLLLIIVSRSISDPYLKDVLLGIGLALAPGGILGFLVDYLVFGHLIEGVRSSTSDLEAKTTKLTSQVEHLIEGVQLSTADLERDIKSETSSLGLEIHSLSVSTEFLKQSSSLGLEMIYPDRATALKYFFPFMQEEAQRKDGHLFIVGSSVRGLVENVKGIPDIVKNSIQNGCDLKILITHPEYSHYRENQEDRPTGAIEDEIFEGIRSLESCVDEGFPNPPDHILSSHVKLYKGTPTCFLIVAGNHMLVNPYPYEEEAFRSFCISVRKVEGKLVDSERTIYSQYIRAHFEKPWKRNAVSYRHYWLEGPNPARAWDRDSCYGDVFVVQDAGHFHIAIYLNGNNKELFRGMPTSIPWGQGEQENLALPQQFSVGLFENKSNSWRHLDGGFGSLMLHTERRRGKISGKVEGNFQNDYLMLGLFDKDDMVTNPHHNDSTLDGLKDQPLPFFYVWLHKTPQIEAPESS